MILPDLKNLFKSYLSEVGQEYTDFAERRWKSYQKRFKRYTHIFDIKPFNRWTDVLEQLNQQEQTDTERQDVGCQLWGILGRLIADRPTTDKEQDALKRRLFAYTDILETYGYTLQDIQQITGADELRTTLGQLDTTDSNYIFHG